MHLDELDYVLPEELIAQRPLAQRDASRLLVVGGVGEHGHARFSDLPQLLEPGLLVLNDTRVRKARLFGRKPSGGRVELLVLSPAGGPMRFVCMGRASKPLAPGTEVILDGTAARARIAARLDGGLLEVAFEGVDEGADIFRAGHVPLPPYIRREAQLEDETRYQTVYARRDGAAAAPTAGLHFTDALLQACRDRGHALAYVTLHVGLGTFAPVKSERLTDHPMHAEWYEVPQSTVDAIDATRAEGRAVTAVGTTVVRSLEAAAASGTLRAQRGETTLLICPPYDFKVVDALITNFHLPRSTLMALVMALGGIEEVRDAYRAAIAERYRFFSYGDAMLVRRRAQRGRVRDGGVRGALRGSSEGRDET